MATNNDIFKYGTVVDVSDDLDGGRVKVHIKGVDPVKFTLDDIPYSFPLLPKQFYVKPKIGETVLVFVQNDSYLEDRFFIGPIISQPDKMDYDSVTALAFLKSGLIRPGTAPSTEPENIGVQMGPNDVGIQGRGSTDMIVKPDEIRIRAGKSLDLRKLNRDNPSYIQVKYDRATSEGAINLVADNINLLSHNGVKNYNLIDANNMISDEDYAKILEKAHQLPFGDKLVELLNIIIKALTTHVHAYAGLAPDLNQIEVKNLIEYDLNKILSNNVRIN